MSKVKSKMAEGREEEETGHQSLVMMCSKEGMNRSKQPRKGGRVAAVENQGSQNRTRGRWGRGILRFHLREHCQ